MTPETPLLTEGPTGSHGPELQCGLARVVLSGCLVNPQLILNPRNRMSCEDGGGGGAEAETTVGRQSAAALS